MRSLAVVAYPTLSNDDRRWIEGIRATYDPLASRIAAHFTLVFPMEIAEATLVAHAREAIRSTNPISIVIRRAAAYPDPIGSGCSVFLLAEEGHRELLAVHDRLYQGPLAAHRRPGIPFMPHVTVGAHPQVGECERIASQLNAEHRIVRARITSVDIIEVGESRVHTVAEIPLRSGGNPPRSPTVQRTDGLRRRPSRR